MEIITSVFQFPNEGKIYLFHVVVFQRTFRKLTKFENARAELLFCLLGLLFQHVVVATQLLLEVPFIDYKKKSN